MQPEISETSYAYLERLRFISAALVPAKNGRVLDIGCGTGKLLSQPLTAMFPEATFYLVENDLPSLNEAKKNLQTRANCHFSQELPSGVQFDAAIASEVLEHVEAPRDFLRNIRRQLKPGGKLLITVPNGYGPSEALASLEFLLKIVRRKIAPKKNATKAVAGEDTHAYSPHIQFYGLNGRNGLKTMLAEEGYELQKIQSRMLVCGFPVSLLIDKFVFAQRANVWLGKHLPLCFSSDWMIEAKRTGAETPLKKSENPVSTYTKLKRLLSTHPLLKGGEGSNSAVDHFSETSTSFFENYAKDPDFMERRQLWAGLAKKYSTAGGTAVDLGCGPGILSQSLLSTGMKVIATDGSKEMLELCRKNNAGAGDRLELIQARLPEIRELDGRKCNLLFCSSVLEYIDDLPLALKKLSSLIQPGGTAAVSFPNRSSLYRRFERLRYRLTGSPDYLQYVHTMLNKSEMESLFRQHDLELVEHHFYGLGAKKQRVLMGFLPRAWRKNLLVGVFRKRG